MNNAGADRVDSRDKKQIIFYGWFIVVVGIMSYALGYGGRYSFSVIFPALLEEFGWYRDSTAIMLSIHMVLYGVVAPLAGHLVDRIGPRHTMTIGIVLFSSGLLLSGMSSRLWHFCITFGILCGAGLSLIGAVPFTTVIKNWFEARRGLALACLYSGTGGAFVLYPGIAFLINKVGWRYTFVIEGIFITALLLPLYHLIVRYHPGEKGLVIDGKYNVGSSPASKKSRSTQIMDESWAAVSWTLPLAMKTGRFWLLCLSTFSVWGITQHILVTHHVAFAVDVGFSKVYASSALSLIGVFFSLGALSALISDRIGREQTVFLGAVIGISGLIVFLFIEDTSHPWMLFYYAITFGFGLGIISPSIAASATDLFQGPKVGAILGFVWFSFAIGGAIGPWFGGWIFELTGSYQLAFIIAIVFYVLACAAIWFSAPRKVRRVAGKIKHA